MSGGTSSDVFIPQVATDSIVAGISDEGVKVLYGSEAVNVSPTLGAQGMLKVGRKLTIPYFGMIPTWQDDVPEGALRGIVETFDIWYEHLAQDRELRQVGAERSSHADPQFSRDG